MKKRMVLLAAALALLALLCVVGCGGGGGGSNAPSESEVGTRVYPGAEYIGPGSVSGTYMYTSKDSSTEVVNWYRKELAGEQDLTETNTFAEATTGDALSYSEDGKSVWITVTPGMEGKPTSIDISVSKAINY